MKSTNNYFVDFTFEATKANNISTYYYLRNIATMINLRTLHDVEKLVNAFTNLFLKKVHPVQNVAACLFTRKIKPEPITPVLFNLQLSLGTNYQSCKQHKQYNTWKSVIIFKSPYHNQVGTERKKEKAEMKNKQIK